MVQILTIKPCIFPQILIPFINRTLLQMSCRIMSSLHIIIERSRYFIISVVINRWLPFMLCFVPLSFATHRGTCSFLFIGGWLWWLWCMPKNWWNKWPWFFVMSWGCMRIVGVVLRCVVFFLGLEKLVLWWCCLMPRFVVFLLWGWRSMLMRMLGVHLKLFVII